MVRSTSRAGLTSTPAAASRAKVSALAGSMVTPRLAGGATTQVAPPPLGPPPRRGRHHADALAPAAGRDRHAREQRQALEQALERIDPRNAAGLEKLIGDVVFARERAGVRNR